MKFYRFIYFNVIKVFLYLWNKYISKSSDFSHSFKAVDLGLPHDTSRYFTIPVNLIQYDLIQQNTIWYYLILNRVQYDSIH